MLSPGDLVRVNPRTIRGHGRHWGRGRVIAVEGNRIAVKPFGRHRRVEVIGLGDVKVWKAKESACA